MIYRVFLIFWMKLSIYEKMNNLQKVFEEVLVEQNGLNWPSVRPPIIIAFLLRKPIGLFLIFFKKISFCD